MSCILNEIAKKYFGICGDKKKTPSKSLRIKSNCFNKLGDILSGMNPTKKCTNVISEAQIAYSRRKMF